MDLYPILEIEDREIDEARRILIEELGKQIEDSKATDYDIISILLNITNAGFYFNDNDINIIKEYGRPVVVRWMERFRREDS